MASSELSIDGLSAEVQHIAEIIEENTTIAYTLGPDGLVDPATIRIFSALGAAHMVLHELRKQEVHHA